MNQQNGLFSEGHSIKPESPSVFSEGYSVIVAQWATDLAFNDKYLTLNAVEITLNAVEIPLNSTSGTLKFRAKECHKL